MCANDGSLLLRALAEHLPDELLRAIHPHASPTACRQILLHTAGRLDIGSACPPSGPTEKRITGEKLTLFTDGASRGNPGDAAAGFTIQDHTGEERTGGGRYLGKATNNAAEYQALILGLQHSLSFAPKALAIHLDSELIVKQIQGHYKVRHPDLIPLFTEVKRLLAQLPSWTVGHVPRSRNKRADQLANMAIDKKWLETVLVRCETLAHAAKP